MRSAALILRRLAYILVARRQRINSEISEGPRQLGQSQVERRQSLLAVDYLIHELIGGPAVWTANGYHRPEEVRRYLFIGVDCLCDTHEVLQEVLHVIIDLFRLPLIAALILRNDKGVVAAEKLRKGRIIEVGGLLSDTARDS